MTENGPDPRAPLAPVAASPVPGEVSEGARRVRPTYQKGLLAWFVDPADPAGPALMDRAVRELLPVIAAGEARRLWWVASGVTGALEDGALAPGVNLKRLMGQLDRALKDLVERDRAAAAEPPPGDLLEDLLRALAEVRDPSPEIAGILATFDRGDRGDRGGRGPPGAESGGVPALAGEAGEAEPASGSPGPETSPPEPAAVDPEADPGVPAAGGSQVPLPSRLAENLLHARSVLDRLEESVPEEEAPAATDPAPEGTAPGDVPAGTPPGFPGGAAGAPVPEPTADEVLDRLLEGAGEMSVARSRLERHIGQIEDNLEDMDLALARLRDRLREVLAAHPDAADLEETLDQVADLTRQRHLLGELVRSADAALGRHARAAASVEQDLLRSRTATFGRYRERFEAALTDAAEGSVRPVVLRLEGGDTGLDRAVAERIAEPVEALLRHAATALGTALTDGKAAPAEVRLTASREGHTLVVEVTHGAGGGARPGPEIATRVTGIGGRLEVEDGDGDERRYRVVLPLREIVEEVLLVECASEIFAFPFSAVAAVRRPSAEEYAAIAARSPPAVEDGATVYPIASLSGVLGLEAAPPGDGPVPILLLASGGRQAALRVDALKGRRELAVKRVGPQLHALEWVGGAAIVEDGRVALVIATAGLLALVEDRGHPGPPDS